VKQFDSDKETGWNLTLEFLPETGIKTHTWNDINFKAWDEIMFDHGEDEKFAIRDPEDPTKFVIYSWKQIAGSRLWKDKK